MSRCSDVGTMTERNSARSVASSRGSDEFLLGGGIQGRSTLSLCSCDADKYNGQPYDPHRSLIYQYSLDRRAPRHTYTCEQNANIIMRLERDRQNSSLKRQHTGGHKQRSQHGGKTKSRQTSHYRSASVVDITDATNANLPLSVANANAYTITDHQNTHGMTTLDRHHHHHQVHFPQVETGKCKRHSAHNGVGFTTHGHGQGCIDTKRPTTPHRFEDHGSKPGALKVVSCGKPASVQQSPCVVEDSTPGPPADVFRELQRTGHTPTCPRRFHDQPPLTGEGGHFELMDRRCYGSEPDLAPYDIARHLAGCPQAARGYTHLEEDGVCFGGVPDITRAHRAPGIPLSIKTDTPWRHRGFAATSSHASNPSSSSGSSSRLDFSGRHWWVVTGILLIAGAAGVGVPLALRVAEGLPLEERLQMATRLLTEVPLIDGHNDLAWNVRKFLHNQLKDFKFSSDLRNTTPWSKSVWSHTDLIRLRQGRVGAQFWAAYVPCEAQHRDAVQITLEQIDVIRRLTDMFHPPLTPCVSVDDIRKAHEERQTCSLVGVEGGHALGDSLAVLRVLYALGVRYLTLTSTCHTPWADSALADETGEKAVHGGLTAFGKTVVREMNRLGMIVDLSHVSSRTARDAIGVSKAPVIFSHSSAYALCNSSRNVQDSMLKKIAANKGIVMVNFYSKFLSCKDESTVDDAVAHINHIREVAGVDHVGLGAGYDGINFTPVGLQDVSSYPLLFAELLGAGWTDHELTKLAGENFLRVMSQVEKVRDEQRKSGVTPYEELIQQRGEEQYNCSRS